MARRSSTFKQSDVTRALKAARSAGENVVKVEIDKDGKIIVTLNSGGAPNDGGEIIL